jgi:uncharacterized protein YjbI with pentapeptide repeats
MAAAAAFMLRQASSALIIHAGCVMTNCDLAAVHCSNINFSGCTFGWREGGAEEDVRTKFGKKIENCDMRGCSFNGVKMGGDWIKVTCHTSHVTHHTSHVTLHTPHFTRHTSHVTRRTSLLQVNLHSLRCSSACFKAASYTSCCMSHSEFDACALSSMTVTGCVLTNSQWRNCKLSGA